MVKCKIIIIILDGQNRPFKFARYFKNLSSLWNWYDNYEGYNDVVGYHVFTRQNKKSIYKSYERVIRGRHRTTWDMLKKHMKL